MKLFDLRSVLAIAAMALLSACGGSDTPAADSAPMAPPLAANANGPVADCEAEGCNRPRIIDGLAEQYRAGAALQAAPAVEPVQAGVLPVQAPAPASEAAPAVLAPPQAPPPN